MYELPSLIGVSKVVIDESCIKGDSDPIMIYEKTKKSRIKQGKKYEQGRSAS